MLRKCAFTFFVLSLLVIGEVVTARAGSSAPSYPDWAAAVVPAYPHALPSSRLITPKMYGIATTDPMPTVVAWYKSRVHGAWSESEGGNTWSVKSGGVRIQISANFYDESGKEKPGTRVALTRYP
ncbi:MAG: hypothetical protein LAO18_10700 [Acidobacteriia bacterium]|nr:hypothetical protein [Terriglobia bacterium]